MNPFLETSEPKPVRRTWGQRFVLLFNMALITASLSVAGLLNYANDKASAINRVALDRSLTEVAEVESGARVLNILLVGSDSSAALDADDPIQIGRQGERFGDVIIVAHIDERAGSVALLSLPRDLWVPIAGTQREDRINRAFLVGGPATLIDTIEETFGFPIHHYVNVDFAGFQGLVEAVGSVDVFFETPARDWNVNARPEPRSQTGFIVETPGCHSLAPEQALAYVRSRYYQTQDVEGRWVTDPTSDLGRIQRQQDFLQRLMQKAIDLGARNPLVLGNLIDAGVQNVAIDQELTPSLLVDLSGTYRSFEPGDLQTYTYPASDGTVGSNRVLIPHHDIAEPIVALFNGEPFDSPATVRIELKYDESMAPEPLGPVSLPRPVRPVADLLTAADFFVDDGGVEQVESGLWIRHGRDGAAAAELALHAFAELGPTELQRFGPPQLVEVPYLSGRHVIVALGAVPDLSIDTESTGSELGPLGPRWIGENPPLGPADGQAVTTDPAASAPPTAPELQPRPDGSTAESNDVTPSRPTIGEVDASALSPSVAGCGS